MQVKHFVSLQVRFAVSIIMIEFEEHSLHCVKQPQARL